MRTGQSPIARGKLAISGARAAPPAVKETLRVSLLPLLARLHAGFPAGAGSSLQTRYRACLRRLKEEKGK